MKKDFSLIWSFRNRIDVLKQSIETADKTCPKSVKFILVDASSNEETIKELRLFCSKIQDRTIRICESNYRSSLAEAWNIGIMLSETRYVIFSSSDVEFISEEWFFQLANSVNCGGEYVLLENHAVFIIDKAIIPKMGWFDEGFKLGPHFDSEFMLRGSEANVRFSILINNNRFYKHGDVDLDTRQKNELIDRLPMNDLSNEKYFMSKWKSEWDGWSDKTHPPTHISQAQRQFAEIDPHPFYTKKYQELYGAKSTTSPFKSLSK